MATSGLKSNHTSRQINYQKICALRGWPSGTPDYKKTFDSMIKIWEGLKNKADANKDGQVSVEEWATMWDEFSKNSENPLDWQIQYMKFMFEMEDSSGDGAIDIDEFTGVCSCYGLNAQECRQAFQKMAQGQPSVNYEQFEELWKQFFTSENPSDPGNYIFGKTSF